ncbi:general transcription factor II-I repeat domain-containing protein 2-like [Schistocerca nitens]|uniref:general transcription factor II-I repeat domain-containing protein 2-like n=1 Tax=Schistocerca nitens TaxID=7011 RepID=UPI0021187C3A|nr:general transcription factor II-I repeat domain-containing protein 2-like [Schistocerca nitens]
MSKVFNSAKRYNIQRHYTHLNAAHYDQVEGVACRELVARLMNDIAGDVNESGENTTESAIRASYRVAHNIATSGKPFSMEPLVKLCMVAVAECLFPREVQAIEGVCLSKQTMSCRILDMAADLDTQFRKKAESFVAFSLALDESTDISDCAQLAVFVRGVDMELQVTEELLDVIPLDYTATGSDIFEAVCESVDNMYLETVELGGVMKDVMKGVNFVRRHGMNLHQFKGFLKDMEAEYGDIPYHSTVRWLSRGKVLDVFFALLEEISLFLKMKGEEMRCLKDIKWISDLAFLADITIHLNNLNLSLQGKGQLIIDTHDQIKAFIEKLRLFERQMSNGHLTFSNRLASLKLPEGTNFSDYQAKLKQLITSFETRFRDLTSLEIELKVFSTPFSVSPHDLSLSLQLVIIYLQNTTLLKERYYNMLDLSQ